MYTAGVCVCFLFIVCTKEEVVYLPVCICLEMSVYVTSVH